MNIALEPELCTRGNRVTAYDGENNYEKALSGKVAGVNVKKAESVKIRGASSLAIPSEML
jgi:hypothetical protein